MLIPGHIENFIMMVDCLNLGVWNMPYGMIKSVIQTLQSQYKCMSRIIYVLNSPSTFSVVWKVVRNAIDTNTAKKV